MKHIYTLLIIFLLNFLYAQENNKVKVEICTWQGDKKGAISISFDDASYSQYEFAFPVLKKNNLTATFSLVGEWTKEVPNYSAEPGMFKIKKMGWNEIINLKNAGNEIAAHGYKHQKYNKHLPVDTLTAQMKKIKQLIESRLASPVYTLHYPYSATSENIIAASKKAGFLFGRTYDDRINDATPENMNLLYSKAIINDTIPNLNQLQQWIFQAQGKWLVLMYHHLFPKGSKEMRILNYHKIKDTYSLFPETFEKQMKTVSQSGYMIAPIATVGRYIIERNNTRLSWKKSCHKLRLKTQTDLDSQVYNVPLTLKIKIPWKKVSIKGSKRDGIFEVKDNYLLIDVLPNSMVIIKKKK